MTHLGRACITSDRCARWRGRQIAADQAAAERQERSGRESVVGTVGELATTAQGYREIEYPKLKNLERAGSVIFLYSLIFTAGTAFFVVMIIPDAVRSQYSTTRR